MKRNKRRNVANDVLHIVVENPPAAGIRFWGVAS